TQSRDAFTSSGTVLNASVASGNAAWFQTSIPIYRGQSGSPALDPTGHVVGVVRGLVAGQPHDAWRETAHGQAMVIAVAMVSRDRFAELVEGPSSRGMHRDIDMQDATGGTFHHNKDIKQAKGGCDHQTEITGHDRLSMVAHKRCPTL